MLTKVFCLMGIVILWVLGSAVTSCSGRGDATQQELNEYLLNEKNGLIKSTSKGDIDIQVTYKPSELVWVNELNRIKDSGARDELRKSYDSLKYFILHFSRKGKEIENAFVSNPASFRAVVDYLSFELRDNVFLINGSDTARALDVVYTRTFGGSDGTSVLAVFDQDLVENSPTIKVCLNDTMLGLGLTEFEFDVNDIKSTPNLTFK